MIDRWINELRDYIGSPRGVPDRVSESIRDEIAFHLSESVGRRIEQGTTAEEAYDASLEQFGPIDGVVRACTSDAADVHSRWHRRHLAFTAMLLAAAAALGAWTYRAINAPPWIGDGDLVGQVVDETGKPVSGAHVLAVVKTWPQEAFRQLAYTTVTGDDGTYRIDDIYPLDEEYAVQIAVLADQRVLKSNYIDPRKGELEPIDFRLQGATPLAVRFESPDGCPMMGVHVIPSSRTDANGDMHGVYFCSAGPIVEETDADGRVTLPYFSPGDRAAFFVRPPGGEWLTEEAWIDASGEVVVQLPNSS